MDHERQQQLQTMMELLKIPIQPYQQAIIKQMLREHPELFESVDERTILIHGDPSEPSPEREVYADREYEKFRDRILKRAAEPAIVCPFCGDGFPENCDYVDIGVGSQQSTPNVCEECGAYEQGCYDRSEQTHEFRDGWCRAKELNNGAPGPCWNPDDNPLDFFGDQ